MHLWVEIFSLLRNQLSQLTFCRCQVTSSRIRGEYRPQLRRHFFDGKRLASRAHRFVSCFYMRPFTNSNTFRYYLVCLCLATYLKARKQFWMEAHLPLPLTTSSHSPATPSRALIKLSLSRISSGSQTQKGHCPLGGANRLRSETLSLRVRLWKDLMGITGMEMDLRWVSCITDVCARFVIKYVLAGWDDPSSTPVSHTRPLLTNDILKTLRSISSTLRRRPWLLSTVRL